MKKIYSILAGLLLTASLFAQAPQKMSYQAVIRNSSNALVMSTPVGMRISVIQGSIFGASVYVETQTPSTNANGLVSLEIGTGTVITGAFSSINWSNGPYFIKTETDPTGGTAYSITGTSELLSVPYAFHSETSDTSRYVSNNIIALTSGNTYNNINVDGISVIYANLIPGTTDVVINGLSNGKIGQVVYIANIANPYNNGVNIIIQSNNSLGDQKFDSPMNGGTNYINSGHGFACFFDGVLWRVMWSGM